MDPSQLEQMLRRNRDSIQERTLPDDFATQVIRDGRRLRLERTARRVLIGGTVAAMLLAGVIGFSLAHSRAQNAPPALSLFQSRGDLPVFTQ